MNNQKLKEHVEFFTIFKEIAINDMGLMHGFKNWAYKIDMISDGDDLLITIPPVLIIRGGDISRSSKKPIIDYRMDGRKNYTYIEYVIKRSCDKYAALKGKTGAKLTRKGVKK